MKSFLLKMFIALLSVILKFGNKTVSKNKGDIKPNEFKKCSHSNICKVFLIISQNALILVKYTILSKI